MVDPITKIIIDLCPYAFSVQDEGQTIVIHECGGSILSKLYDPREERIYSVIYSRSDSAEDIHTAVYFEPALNECVFSTKYLNNETLTPEHVIEWISGNFDAIQSIGYELLTKG